MRRQHHPGSNRPGRTLTPTPWSLGVLTWVLVARLIQAGGARRRDERGDVPGWVMITVMSAGLVAALWAIAGPELERMLRSALSSVA